MKVQLIMLAQWLLVCSSCPWLLVMYCACALSVIAMLIFMHNLQSCNVNLIASTGLIVFFHAAFKISISCVGLNPPSLTLLNSTQTTINVVWSGPASGYYNQFLVRCLAVIPNYNSQSVNASVTGMFLLIYGIGLSPSKKLQIC